MDSRVGPGGPCLMNPSQGYDGSHNGSHQAWAKINGSFCNGLMGSYGMGHRSMGVGSSSHGWGQLFMSVCVESQKWVTLAEKACKC